MKEKGHKGFTLIEVIIALICISLLAAMIISFGGDFVSRSTNPVALLSRASDLQRGMDNVTRAYYNQGIPIRYANLNTFKDNLTADATIINVTGVSVDASRTRFIIFDGGNTEIVDSSPATNTSPRLKVTLINTDGQSVSTIFTSR
jgi:prepilin-type N-terminal cleavage/methylation domain-containing protein